MTSHCGKDMIEAFFQQQRRAVLSQVISNVANERLDIALAQHRRHRADQQGGRAEPLDRQAKPGERRRRSLDPVAVRLVQFHHFRDQQRLAGCHCPLCAGGLEPFQHEPFMRGVLIDDDQAVLGLGHDIGVGDLPARDAQRMIGLRGIHGLLCPARWRRQGRGLLAAPRHGRIADHRRGIFPRKE